MARVCSSNGQYFTYEEIRAPYIFNPGFSDVGVLNFALFSSWLYRMGLAKIKKISHPEITPSLLPSGLNAFFQRTSQKGQHDLRGGRRRSEQCSPALIERQQRWCGLVRSCVALILAQEVFRHPHVPPACDPARGSVHSFPSPPFGPSLFFVSSVGKLRDLGYMQVTVKWNQRASNWTILDSAY